MTLRPRHSPLKILIACFLLFFVSLNSLAASYTWTGLGADANWTTVGNWFPNSIPSNLDEVTIPSQYPLGVPITNFPEIQNTVTISELTIETNASLTLGANLIVAGAITNGGTINVAGHELSAVSISGGAVNTTDGTITTTGTITTLGVSGSATLNGGAGLTITDPIVGAPNLVTSGTVNLQGVLGALEVSGILNLSGITTLAGNLEINAGTVNLSDILSIEGNLTIASGTSLNANNHNINIAGNWDNQGTFAPDGADQTLSFNGTNAQEITNGGISFNRLVIDKTDGTVSASTDIETNDTFTLTNGTFSNGASTVSLGGNYIQDGGAFTQGAGELIVGSDFTQNDGAFTQGSGAISLSGSTISIAGTFEKDADNGLIIFNAGGAQSLSADGQDLGNIQVSTANTALTIANQTISFDDIEIDTDTTLNLSADVSATSLQINLGKTITNNGSFTLVDSNENISLVGISGLAHFTGNEINFNGKNLSLGSINYEPNLNLGTSTVTLTDSNNQFSSINLGTGIFNANAQNWQASGSWDNTTGTLSGTTGTATFTGTAQAITTGGTEAGKTFGPLVINSATSLVGFALEATSLSGTGSLETNSQNVTINGNCSIGTLTGSSGTILITGNVTSANFTGGSGNITIDGSVTSTTFTASSGTTTIQNNFTPTNFTHNGGKIVFAGSNTPVNASGFAYYDLEINKGDQAQIVNLSATATVAHDLLITQGTLSLGGALTVPGNLHIYGRLTQSGNLTVTGNIFIYATGILTTGNYNLSASNITQTAAGARLIASGQIGSEKTISFSNNLTFVAGGFTTGTHTTLVSTGTGSITSAGNTLTNLRKNTGGTVTLADVATLTGNLEINAGTVNLSDTLTISGDITIAAPATLNANNHDIHLAGNWDNQGTFTPGGADQTLTFSGTGNQSIVHGGVSFNRVVVDKATGAVLANTAVTTSDSFTLTLGTFENGANTVTIGSDYSQSGGTFTQGSGALTVDGDFTQTAGTFTQDAGLITLNGATISIAGTFTKNASGNIIFNRGGAQSLHANGKDLGNIEISTVSTVLTIANQTITFDDIEIYTDASLSVSADTAATTIQIHAGKTITNSGSFTLANSTKGISLVGASGLAHFSGTSISFSGQNLSLGSINYEPNLNLGTSTVTLTDSNNQFSSINLGTGIFNANSHNWQLSGSWNNTDGALSGATGTATFTGTTQTITTGGTGVGKGFGTLTINGTYSLEDSPLLATSLSGAGSLNTNGQDITINGNCSIETLTGSSGIILITGDLTSTTFTGGSGNITIDGSVTSATFTASSGSTTVQNNFTPTTFIHNDGKIVFAGSNTPVNASGFAYYDLEINKDDQAQIVNLSATAAVTHNLLITQGTLSLGGALTVPGDLHVYGNLTQGGNLTVTGNIFIYATGILTTGNYNLSATTISQMAAGARLIASAQTGTEKTISFSNNLTFVAGGFTTGTHTILVSTGTGSITSAGNTHTNLRKNTGGTVTLADVATLTGNLEINAGTVNLSDTLTVSGGITIATLATLNANNHDIHLAGNWDNQGTFTPGVAPTTQTFTLNGTVQQTFANGSESFNNLNITNSTTINITGNLTIAGTTTINASNITSSGTQTYGDATGTDTITLGASTNLTGTTISFKAPVVGGTNALTITGNAVFGDNPTDTLTGITTLTVTGTTQINTASITTTGAQIYGDAITLGTNVTLDSGAGNITFASTVDGTTAGTQTLILNTTGTSSLQAVGSTTTLASLTTNAGGSTTLNGNVTTTGTQIYGDAVTLGNNDLTLTAKNASNELQSILFLDTIDGNNQLLIIAGNATFGDAPTDTVTNLISLSISGTSAINTSTITTTGMQAYSNAVTLGTDVTLNAGSGAITFGSTLTGTIHTLTAQTSGSVIFNGTTNEVTLSELTIKSNDLEIKLPIHAQTIRLYTFTPTTTIVIGGAAGAFTLNDTEFKLLRYTGTAAGTGLIIGESGVQSGRITFQTATPGNSAKDSRITVNSNAGAGAVHFDDEGTATALTTGGSGAITINAGTGGIRASQTTGTHAEIETKGIITLSSAGAIGSSTHRIQFAGGQDEIDILSAPAGIWLDGLGNLSLGSASTNQTSGGGSLDITTQNGGNLILNRPWDTGTGNINLSPEGSIILAHNGTIITQTSADLLFNSPVLLAENATITQSTGSSLHTILFAQPVNNTGINTHSLTISAGASIVQFAKQIGNTVAPSAITITSSATNGIQMTNTDEDDDIIWIKAGTLTINGNFSSTTKPNINPTFITSGTLTLNGNFSSIASPTFISSDISLGSGVWDWGASNTLRFYTYTPTTPMNIGFSQANQWSLDDSEIAQLTTGGKIIFGESGTQAGSITFQTTDFSSANTNTGIEITANSNASGGSITLNNSSTVVALNAGTKDINLNAFSAISANSPNDQGHIKTTGTITLNVSPTAGQGLRIGQGDLPSPPTNPIQIVTGHTEINASGNAPQGIWLEGAGGPINLGSITATGPLITSMYDPSHIIYLTKDISSDGANVIFARPVEIKPESGALIRIDSTGTTDGNISFASTLNDSSTTEGTNNLTLKAGTGNILFHEVGSNKIINELTIESAATINLHADINTKNTQTYNGNIILNNDIFLNSNGSDIILNGKVNGAHTLDISTNGDILINGAIDLDTNLASLTISSDGTTTINTSTITTTGDQVYHGTIDLQTSSTLTGKKITFEKPLTDVTGANLTIETAELFYTHENADITLTGSGSFTQNGAGLNQLAGGITTDTGSISFASNVYLFGTTDDMTFYSNANITFGKNLHIASPGKTINLNSPITVTDSLVLYAGEINFGDTSPRNAITTTNGDLVLLGAGYNIEDPESGIADLFAYNHPDRTDTEGNPLTATPSLTLATAFPDGSPTFPTTYSGTVDSTSLAGKTITVGQNFYVNGVNLEADAEWFLKIPDNNKATDAFAEAYNMSVANSTVTVNGSGTHAWISAAEDVDDDGNNTGWSFDRPEILTSGTYTVYDDVIGVEFHDGAGNPKLIENSNDEISEAVSNIKFHNGAIAFTESFTDPEYTTSTDGAGDLSVFYLRTSQDPSDASQRWNTDATGISAGHADSTDRGRPGVDPEHRNTIPDIDIPKARAEDIGAGITALFQTLRDEHKNRIAHYSGDTGGAGNEDPNSTPGARFTATADRTRPVLVEVIAAQDLHLSDPIVNAANYLPWDAHNYFELRWSEPVVFSDPSGLAEVADIANPAEHAQAHNTPSTASLGAASTTSGELSLAGLFKTISGLHTLNLGVRTDVTSIADLPTDTNGINSLYRTFDHKQTQDNLENGTLNKANQPHRLRVYIAGFATQLPSNSFNWKWFWPGYIDAIESADGSNIQSLENSTIKDLHGNILESDVLSTYNKAIISIQESTTSPWDTTPPSTALYRTSAIDGWYSADQIYEVSPVDTTGDGYINHFEFHFFDDQPTYTQSEAFQWVSRKGWYEGSSRDTPIKPAPDTRGGIRDSSTLKSLSGADISQTQAAFTVGSADLTNEHNERFGTSVIDKIYYEEPINTLDDPYLRLSTTGFNWRTIDEIKISYNKDIGFLTDLAGNRLQSFGPITALNKTPPKFTLSIQPMGTKDLYVSFSKKVDFDSLVDNIYLNTDTTPLKVRRVSDNEPDVKEVIFSLHKTLTLQELQNLTIVTKTDTITDVDSGSSIIVSLVQDTLGNYMDAGESHRVTDFLVNVVSPLYASDGVNEDGTFGYTNGVGEGALRQFDGSGRLQDRDIILGTRIDSGTSSASATPENLQLYFDVNPDASTMPTVFNDWLGYKNELWLPSTIPGFNEQANTEARSETPFQVLDTNQNLRNFRISSNDSEIEMGAQVQFLFKYGDLFAARLKDPADITSLDPWRFNISGIKLQRGGVTIMNNVIDSTKREKTLLTIDMPKSGNLIIQVFTADGNIVRTLERGKKGSGTYTYSWDGSNLSGSPVARGMYFIRVVGPEMDEIRKVMVVKE